MRIKKKQLQNIAEHIGLYFWHQAEKEIPAEHLNDWMFDFLNNNISAKDTRAIVRIFQMYCK